MAAPPMHPLLAVAGTLGDDSTAQTEINSALTAAGLTPDNVQAAIQSYTGLDANAQNAIVGIIKGGLPTSFAAWAPIVAAGLAATGVGAPVVAAVAAALPVLDAIAGAFQSKPPHCDWMIGDACVNGKRPSGPSDPTWQTFAQYIQGSTITFTASPANSQVDAAWPWYRQTIGCELATIGPSPTDPYEQFLRAYYLAWQKNKEYQINGYQSAGDYALLQAVANAWNAVHAAAPMFEIAPMNPAGSSSIFCLYQAHGVRYVNLLLDGDVDNQRYAPLSISLGALTETSVKPLTLHTAGSSASASTTTSKGTAVATGIGLAGAAAAAVWAATTGRLASWLKF